MPTITQQQLNRFFEIISSSKLPSELDEILTIDTDALEIVIQQGANDAKKVKVPLLRGMKGDYSASANTPALVDGIGTEGDTYISTDIGSNDYGSGTVDAIVDSVLFYISGKWKLLNKEPEAAEETIPIITIDSKKFELYKNPDNNDPLNAKVLESNDIIKGFDSNSRYMEAVYLVGDQTLFDDLTVYNRYGGTKL